MGSRVAIIGGHGQIAQHLTRLLTRRGDQVISIIRAREQAERIAQLDAEPVIADIESMDSRDLAPFLRGCDAVVFAAGAGKGSGALRKRTVDYGGSVLSQIASLEAGVPRFVQISALVVDRPIDPEAEHVWKEYVRAKKDADKALRRTALKWTIVRPGVLTNDEATGLIRAAEHLPDLAVDSLTIPREDVAGVVACCLETPQTIFTSFDVVSGDRPIAEAIADL